MIVIKAYIKYKCEKCGLDYIIKFSPLPPGDIIGINKSIDRTKLCTVCGRAAGIEQIVFKTVKDLYGDDLYGSWRCPTHLAFVYYPLLMRKAERNKSSKDLLSDMAKKYRKMIIDGYPWVCPNPGCGKDMIYKNDKEDHVFG